MKILFLKNISLKFAKLRFIIFASLILQFTALLFTTSNSIAMPLLADLSVTKIDIDHNFSGLDILLFGTRKEDGEIIVVVKGPKKNYIIRKKEQIFGMWLNKDAVKIDDTYSFYHSEW